MKKNFSSNRKKIEKKAFTMIEVIIWVFIFSLWLVSVFLLFWQSSKLDIKSRNTIIATNLAKEGVELVKNIRDSNYKTNHKYNWIPNNDSSGKYKSEHFFTWATASGIYYKIENDYNWYLPIKVKKETFNLDNFQLCLDTENRYIYCSASENKETDFYRYLNFKKASYKDWLVEENIPYTFKVTSVVEWKKWWWWKVEIPFILADWKRL